LFRTRFELASKPFAGVARGYRHRKYARPATSLRAALLSLPARLAKPPSRNPRRSDTCLVPRKPPPLLATTLATLIATIPAQAWAQDTSPQQMQRVEITGSSIKRIDAETALPVQVITREQIQKSGAANVEQLLQTISSVSSSAG
jgi:outer membrane receptor protein involved in Fe transport